MNTRQLSFNTEIISRCNGVLPIDIFVNTRLKDGMYIINTHPSTKPGEHWFVVEKSGKRAFIFDSFGSLSPLTRSPFIELFLEHIFLHCSDVKMTLVTLQSLDTNVCGDYCLLYVFARSQKSNARSIINSLLEIDDAHRRDHAVRQVVMSRFFDTLPDDGNGFDRVHIFPYFCS